MFVEAEYILPPEETYAPDAYAIPAFPHAVGVGKLKVTFLVKTEDIV